MQYLIFWYRIKRLLYFHESFFFQIKGNVVVNFK